MRVLVVEDNAELVALLVKGLARSGFSADSVSNAGDAEHSLAAMRYAAIVLDLGLPDQDGLSLLRGIRGRGDSTPVLVLTARDGVSDRVNGLRAGADVNTWQFADGVHPTTGGHRLISDFVLQALRGYGWI